MSQSKKLFQVTSRNELYDIRCFLEDHLPQTCYIHQSLVAEMLAPSDTWCFYVKRGLDGNYEAMVSTIRDKYFDLTSQKFENRWLVSAWMKDETYLTQTLEDIEEIDWFNAKWVIFGHQKIHIQPWIENHAKEIFYSLIVSYVLPLREALALQIEIPDDVYVKSLEREHASIVYDHWPQKITTLVEFVEDEIDKYPSAGVFLKNGDVLVSWIMSLPSNGMSRLHTLEPYRRRGYAALAVRYMAKRMGQSGYLPFANVWQTNRSSRKLFESLGFQFLQDCTNAKYGLPSVHVAQINSLLDRTGASFCENRIIKNS